MSNSDYRPRGYSVLPEVTKNLLIINVIVFVATLIMQNQGFDMVDKFGLHYFASEKFGIWQFITYMFMHDIGTPGNINIAHIGMNMLILFMFGSSVENVWGGKRFLTFYILCGLGAAVSHYAIVYFAMQPDLTFINSYIQSADINKLNELVNSSSFSARFTPEFREMVQNDPAHALSISIEFAKQFKTEMLNAPVVIGASGAIYGLLLAYGMIFPNNILLLFLILPVKAKYAVIIFGVMELFLGISGSDNVAHFAHLGGLVTGFFVMQYWKNKNRRRRNDYFDQSGN
jgi:membrane associated rhomboid family serine protease